jgi:hypothetical protein
MEMFKAIFRLRCGAEIQHLIQARKRGEAWRAAMIAAEALGGARLVRIES